MAAALRHKSVRPGMTCELRRVTAEGPDNERVQVYAKSASTLSLILVTDAMITLQAVGGDSVIYRDEAGVEFKLFFAAAVMAEPEAHVTVTATEVAPVPDRAISHGNVQPDTIMLLEISGEHITATQEVYIVTKAAQGLKVMHANGEHRYLYTNVPETGVYRDGSCRALGMTFRLLPAEEAKPAGQVA